MNIADCYIANGSSKSIGEEPPRLRFDSHQDALDCVRNLVERQERRHVVYTMPFGERYINLGMYVVLRCKGSGAGSEYEFVLFGIPSAREDEPQRPPNRTAPLHGDVPQRWNVRAYDGMFVDVGGIG